ncbi:Uma2 family endonuclease [Mucilaginibacter sp. CAU 1740]|uniref:Uma2 family endonuclease n=1 Tax=Mucilaginibacter sp. CAU 1740 TaxID=3140365 RepID=UPI00325A5D19
MSATIPATAVDIYRMLPEGTRCEVLYNQLIMTPAPNTDHQFISVKLSALLYNYLEETQKGVILHAPADVYFEEEQSVLQPDVLVILNENKSIIHNDGIYGAPDIVFEILSGNRIHDTLKKKNLYEKAGVKEYFIIDPADKKVVMFAMSENNQYELVYELIGKITSEVLGCSFSL